LSIFLFLFKESQSFKFTSSYYSIVQRSGGRQDFRLSKKHHPLWIALDEGFFFFCLKYRSIISLKLNFFFFSQKVIDPQVRSLFFLKKKMKF